MTSPDENVNIQSWINRTGSGFYPGAITSSSKGINVTIRAADQGDVSLEDRLYHSLGNRLHNQQRDHPDNLRLLKNLCEDAVVKMNARDLVNQTTIQRLEDKIYREFVQLKTKIDISRDKHGKSRVDLSALSPSIRVKQRRLANGTGSLIPQANCEDEHMIKRTANLLNKFDIDRSLSNEPNMGSQTIAPRQKNESIFSNKAMRTYTADYFRCQLDNGFGRSTSLYVPGFAHDGSSEYAMLVKRFNQNNTQQELNKQVNDKDRAQ